MKKILIVLAICSLIVGCKTISSYKLSGQVLEGQERLDREGVEDIVSFKRATVFVRPSKDSYTPENDIRPSFIVGVKGEKEFEFSTDNIKVYVDGKPHQILTYEDSLRELNKKFGARIAIAKKQWEEETFKATEDAVRDVNDPVFVVPVGPDASMNRVTNSASGVLGAQTATDTRQMSKDIVESTFKESVELQAIQQELLEAIQKLQSTVLFKTKVSPDKWYAGKVAMDYMPDSSISHKIKVMVNVYGENHEFLLDYIKVQ